MKRNAVLYFALKNKMDYLIFFDDDEYPIANIKIDDSLVWKGQEVLSTHIKNINTAGQPAIIVEQPKRKTDPQATL